MDRTATDTTCDLKEVITALKVFGAGLDLSIVNEVTINVQPNTNPKIDGANKIVTARTKEVQKKLGPKLIVYIKGQRLVMNYHVEPGMKSGNDLKFWVNVK